MWPLKINYKHMKLVTKVSLPEYPFRLDHHSNILMMGSCFTDHIGQQLKKYLFPVCINPFGVIYNPLSVKKGLLSLLNREAYTADDLQKHHELWFSFDHYTGFSSPDRELALQNINKSFSIAKSFLQTTRYLVITLGTAWVYRYKATGEVVCNCHKIPSSRFLRSRLSVDEIITAYQSLLPALWDKDPDLNVILTVSPIRHWKDGANGNQLSKATLLLAIDQLIEQFSAHLFYFPSYEIVMDELRDYRYYGEDLLHLSATATKYIWDKFRESCIGVPSVKIMEELEKLLRMSSHRTRHAATNSHRDMVQKREQYHRKLQEAYPFLRWENFKHI